MSIRRNLLAALLMWMSVLLVNGQTERPRLAVPQPEKIADWKNLLTEEELSALSKSQRPNSRMKTYVRLSAQRLKNAREYINQENFAEAEEQVKGYTALIADAGRVSKESIPIGDKAHKTLELALRAQIRLLEGLKRDLSSAYDEVTEVALQTTEQVRQQALNLLFGTGMLSKKENSP